jgi:hypothetical protein
MISFFFFFLLEKFDGQSKYHKIYKNTTLNKVRYHYKFLIFSCNNIVVYHYYYYYVFGKERGSKPKKKRTIRLHEYS